MSKSTVQWWSNTCHCISCISRSSPSTVHATVTTTAIYSHTDSAAMLLCTLPQSEVIHTIDVSNVHMWIHFDMTQSDCPQHMVKYFFLPLFQFLFSITSTQLYSTNATWHTHTTQWLVGTSARNRTVDPCMLKLHPNTIPSHLSSHNGGLFTL